MPSTRALKAGCDDADRLPAPQVPHLIPKLTGEVQQGAGSSVQSPQEQVPRLAEALVSGWGLEQMLSVPHAYTLPHLHTGGPVCSSEGTLAVGMRQAPTQARRP